MSSQNKPKDSTAGESSNSNITTTKFKALTYTVASSVDCALALTVGSTVGSCDLLMVSFASGVRAHACSCGEMLRCAQ